MSDIIKTIKDLIEIITQNGVVGLLVIFDVFILLAFYKFLNFAWDKFENTAIRHENEMGEFRKYMTEKNGHMETIVDKVTTSFDNSVDKLSVSLERLGDKFDNFDKDANGRALIMTEKIDSIKDILKR